MLVVSILHDAYHARAATQLEKVHNEATTQQNRSTSMATFSVRIENRWGARAHITIDGVTLATTVQVSL